MSRVIRLRGVRQNNLKELDLDLPLGRLIVVTGVSGSGKSSLAFDTLYAEGQRRYVETFSTYARQFLARMDKPDADRIEGIPPAIAIEQKNPVRTSRSTVGTMTEINDYLKLLFAKAGTLHCASCDRKVRIDDVAHVLRRLRRLPENEHVVLSFPLTRVEAGSGKALRARLDALGYTRVMRDGRAARLAELSGEPFDGDVCRVVADRFAAGPELDRKRVADSLETAYRMGAGHLTIHRPDGSSRPYSQHLHCAPCDLEATAPVPNHFSFNSPLGACPACKGFGRTLDLDLDLVVPDDRRSLGDGAIRPWTSDRHRSERADLREHCHLHGISLDVPWRELEETQRASVVEGDDGFYGIRGWFRWLEKRTYKMHVRVLLSRYRSARTCPDCGGARLRPASLLTRVGDRTIADVWALPLHRARRFFDDLELPPAKAEVAELLLREVRNRLRYLTEVGLGYLTLDRPSRTLSGGEAQRVALTTSLGSALVHTLYVLDEPSIGLHARDTERLVRILEGLRDRGNTVVVVEHDPTIIRRADHLLDLGPRAGEHGGEIVYQGDLDGLLADPDSRTGAYLAGRSSVPVPESRRPVDPEDAIAVVAPREHNLAGEDVTLPLGVLVALTGVSGSGKSTLVEDVLYPALKRHLGESVGRLGRHEGLRGADLVEDVVLVDQSPIGRTPRSNPATYVQAWTPIRKLFAATDAAQRLGWQASDFSFNVSGGRCERCQGDGYERVEMQFLADVYVTCPECGGRRFRPEILEVRLRDRSIGDVLRMTLEEARGFFAETSAVASALTPLIEVGLGYLRLGQPATTLSGGEAQRLKLGAHLGRRGGKRTLFLLDEPTTGLHFADVDALLGALHRLVDRGHGVLVIEHNLDVIAAADWIVDLGPEGGADGGRVVAAGPPEALARGAESLTGRFLREHLDRVAAVAAGDGAAR
jgi:excinuclease ABC subunit A